MKTFHLSLKPFALLAAAFLCLLAVRTSSADTLLFEGFEGAFPGTTWTVGDSNPSGTAAYWDDVSNSIGTVPARTGSWKGYCAAVGYTGTAANPVYQPYMNAYMRTTLNLPANYCSPTLTFWYRTPSIETCCDHFQVSVGGQIVFSNAVANSAWTPVVIDLSGFTGTSPVLEFAFVSDLSVQYEGVYLDDITVTATPATAHIYDAWWGPVQDHDADGCVAVQGDYYRLYWDPDASCSSVSLSVFEKVYYRSCGGSTWILYGTTAPHIINGFATADQQYMDIIASPGCSCYEYRIEVYREGQSIADGARDQSNDTDLANHREEYYSQDECLATVYDAWWGPVQDHDGDGCVATANNYMRLYWDPDVVNCSGTLSVFEKIYYRANPAGAWNLYYTTAPHVITGTSTLDQQYVDVVAGAGCSVWDYKIEVYRDGQATPDYTRDQSNDAQLLAHREELYTQDECLVTVYDAWWGTVQDHDADGCVATANNTMRLFWDPDVVNCSGTLTVFEKVYWRLNPAGSWTLFATTAPHVITGTSTLDAQYVDVGSGSSCTAYDYKIEVYRDGLAVPDYTRDGSNDPDLLNHREELYTQDECLVTVYDAWWSGVQDHDGDGCVAGTNDYLRLNWDPDVVNCSGTLSVFEKIYWRTSPAGSWNLYYTTAPHTITGTATADEQYIDIAAGSGCTAYDYKIEVYRDGQATPDYTRDPSNDPDLLNHREEYYATDECLVTVFNAYWGPVQDHDGDGCVASPSNFMRLYWDPDVVNCSGTLTVFEKVYYRLNPAGAWQLYGTTAPHVITGTATADTQYMDIISGANCTAYDYKIEAYRQGQAAPDYTRDPSNDADLLNHREELYTQDECLVTVYDAWWGPQQDGDADGCWANSANAFRLYWDPDVVNCGGTLSVFEMVYYRTCGSSTWTLHTTTAPHTISGISTADTQYTDIPTGTGCSCWEYKIEVYRNGQVVPDYTRDYSNDADLANHHEELYLEDECSLSTVTVYDTWWSNQVDTDGDGCMEPTGPTGGFRLNWDPDVVGCHAPISVFEKIYWRLLPSGSWFLYTTTAPHNITGTASSDQQYVEIPAGAGCAQYDYKVEIYRNGQASPDYTRDNTNDSDLAAHKEEALGRPTLAMHRFGNEVVLSWQTNFVGFTLQGADTLTLPNWPTVLPPPAVTGTEYVVTNSIGVNNQFYRLYKP